MQSFTSKPLVNYHYYTRCFTDIKVPFYIKLGHLNDICI
ncbi:hypothetical protein PTUN_a0216 [Pseudoalteromonas tunicata]|nr:hypothetical protein PTUN_a0216 [Pseudoalteromonas tunicata]